MSRCHYCREIDGPTTLSCNCVHPDDKEAPYRHWCDRCVKQLGGLEGVRRWGDAHEGWHELVGPGPVDWDDYLIGRRKRGLCSIL